VVAGGAAGALIDRLFVSVSIRIDVIGLPEFANRGAATLCLFTTVRGRDRPEVVVQSHAPPWLAPRMPAAMPLEHPRALLALVGSMGATASMVVRA
jgi:hypothetical protein